jgi:hypothetical protein
MATSPVTLDFSKAQPISQPVTLDMSKATPIQAAQPEQQPGFWENLGHSFGVGHQEDAQRMADFKAHPIVSMAENALGPAYAAAKGLAQGGIRSGSELIDAGKSLMGGNAPQAALHAINAVPLVGPALNTMADQSPASTPGQSYASRVLADATPGNVGTALGTSAQAAATLLGGRDIAAGNPPVNANSASTAPRVVPGQNYAEPHAAAFEGALAPATGMGKNFQPQSITPQALTPIRQTAARMTQGSPLEQVQVQAATNPSTPPLTRIRAYQGVVQSALNDLEAQHAQGLASASNVPVNVDPLVQELRSHLSATTDPADVSAIRNLMQRVRGVQDIGDLNTFRQELNNETSAEFKQSQIQAGRSGTSVQAASDLASAVRGAYYDNLSQATGVDYQPLKIQESDLLTTKEALQNQQSTLAKQEAAFNAPSTLKEKIGNLAGIIQNPKVGVTQTLLRESPATRISTLLQKSLADLPPAPSSAPMLGAGAPTPRAMPAPAGPQGGPTPAPPVYAGSAASRLGRMLPAPPIELPGAVQQSVPAYSPDTAAARLGRLLPQQSSAPTILGPDAAAMTPSEHAAALMQYLRRRQQLGLPAQAQPIQLPPPGGYQSLMSLRNGNQ